MASRTPKTKSPPVTNTKEPTPQKSTRISPSTEERDLLKSLFGMAPPLAPDPPGTRFAQRDLGPGGLGVGPTVSGGSDFMDLDQDIWDSMTEATGSESKEPGPDIPTPAKSSSTEPQTTSTFEERLAIFCQKLGVKVPTLEEAHASTLRWSRVGKLERVGRSVVILSPEKKPNEEDREDRSVVNPGRPQLVTPEYEAQVKAEWRAQSLKDHGPEWVEKHFEAEWERTKDLLL